MNLYSPPVRYTSETPEERAERLAEAAFDELRDDLVDEFIEWQGNGIRGLRECDNNPREYVEFSDWLLGRARQYGGRYIEALTGRERELLGERP